MAGSAAVSGLFDAYTRDQAGARQTLALALFGGDKGASDTDLTLRKRIVTAENLVADRPDFLIRGRTDAAETLPLVELIARGVTFPVATGSAATLRNYMRLISVDAFVSGATALTEQGWIRSTWAVVGGATPTVYVTQIPATGSTGVVAAAASPNFFGNQASAVGSTLGDTDVPFMSLISGAGTVTLNMVHATTEIMNFSVEVRVGKLQSLPGGV